MTKYKAGDLVVFNFDDAEGRASARIIKPTKMFPTGQLYRIEIIAVLQESSIGVRAPRPGSKREVAEGHLTSE